MRDGIDSREASAGARGTTGLRGRPGRRRPPEPDLGNASVGTPTPRRHEGAGIPGALRRFGPRRGGGCAMASGAWRQRRGSSRSRVSAAARGLGVRRAVGRPGHRAPGPAGGELPGSRPLASAGARRHRGGEPHRRDPPRTDRESWEARPGCPRWCASVRRSGSAARTWRPASTSSSFSGWTVFELVIMGHAANATVRTLTGFDAVWVWILAFGGAVIALGLWGPVAVVREWLTKFALWAVLVTTGVADVAPRRTRGPRERSGTPRRPAGSRSGPAWTS